MRSPQRSYFLFLALLLGADVDATGGVPLVPPVPFVALLVTLPSGTEGAAAVLEPVRCDFLPLVPASPSRSERRRLLEFQSNESALLSAPEVSETDFFLVVGP